MDTADTTITPGAAPETPGFMADTDVRENRLEDGTLHTVTLTHRPTGLAVTSAHRELAEASLGTEVARVASAAGTVHGADPQALSIEDARAGRRYRVSFEDCCVSGVFEATVKARNLSTGSPEGAAILFDNGVRLFGHGVRLEEMG